MFERIAVTALPPCVGDQRKGAADHPDVSVGCGNLAILVEQSLTSLASWRYQSQRTWDHGEQRAAGTTAREIISSLSAIKFDVKIGYNQLVADDVDANIEESGVKSAQDQRGNGYRFVVGVRAFMSGKRWPQGAPSEITVALQQHGSSSARKTLQSGAHSKVSILQAFGIVQKVDVFLSHCQSKKLAETIAAMVKYEDDNEMIATLVRFWVDYPSLPPMW